MDGGPALRSGVGLSELLGRTTRLPAAVNKVLQWGERAGKWCSHVLLVQSQRIGKVTDDLCSRTEANTAGCSD